MNPITIQSESFWTEHKPSSWLDAYQNSWTRKDRQELIKILMDIHWHSILEIGCNCAPVLTALEASFTDFRYEGLDINSLAIYRAKRNHPEARFYLGSVNDELPKFPDNNYDIVLSSSILGCLAEEDALNTLNEMIRIASKAVIVQEPIFEKHDGNFHWFNHDYKKMIQSINQVTDKKIFLLQ